MKVSQLTLIILAALVWYAGGIALLLKGSALIKSAYVIDAQSLWTFAAPLLGVIAGLLKGKFLFSKSCKKNIQRIRSLANPHVWQCFRPRHVNISCDYYSYGGMDVKGCSRELHLSLPCWCT